MKNLLVPTDFSSCAEHALQVAVQLAETFHANLHLLTCLDLPEDWDNLTEAERSTFPEALQRSQNAHHTLEAIEKRYPDLTLISHITGEDLPERVAAFVADRGIDLIVMGSHGTQGKSEFFIGSNTQRVVRTVHCPVMVVKHPIEDLRLEKVVFASSFNENEKPAFLRFKDIIKHFIPEVHLVAIHTSSLFDPPYILSKEAMEDFKALCHPLRCETHVIRDISIEQGIRSFSGELGAQLIGISNHHRRPLRRMLVGSKVEALVNHSELPVLSIDFAEAPEASENADS